MSHTEKRKKVTEVKEVKPPESAEAIALRVECLQELVEAGFPSPRAKEVMVATRQPSLVSGVIAWTTDSWQKVKEDLTSRSESGSITADMIKDELLSICQSAISICDGSINKKTVLVDIPGFFETEQGLLTPAYNDLHELRNVMYGAIEALGAFPLNEVSEDEAEADAQALRELSDERRR